MLTGSGERETVRAQRRPPVRNNNTWSTSLASILIIDDDPAVCEILQSALEIHGHEVTSSTVTDNLPGLLTPPPDVVLLDVCMPETNGLECLPHIQQLAPASQVVVVTGVNDYHVADLFYELGVVGFLTKPVHVDQLTATLDRILTPAPPSRCS